MHKAQGKVAVHLRDDSDSRQGRGGEERKHTFNVLFRPFPFGWLMIRTEISRTNCLCWITYQTEEKTRAAVTAAAVSYLTVTKLSAPPAWQLHNILSLNFTGGVSSVVLNISWLTASEVLEVGILLTSCRLQVSKSEAPLVWVKPDTATQPTLCSIYFQQ